MLKCRGETLQKKLTKPKKTIMNTKKPDQICSKMASVGTEQGQFIRVVMSVSNSLPF